MTTIHSDRWAALGAVALLATLTVWVVALFAAEDTPSFKKRGAEERRFAESVGVAVIKTLHPTGKKVVLLKHEYTYPKPNRTELNLKMEYYGVFTGKRYVADVVVKIDSTSKEEWEVLNIEYADNNTIPASQKKIQELIRKFNR